VSGLPAQGGGTRRGYGRDVTDIWDVRAVLLDMDGTLLDTERVYFESLVAALNAFEDSNHGVTAAYAAGTITIMVPDMAPPTAESARTMRGGGARSRRGAGDIASARRADAPLLATVISRSRRVARMRAR
jgi:beta-phosphoglucomutase-like phosphatase (HAD superfamily)